MNNAQKYSGEHHHSLDAKNRLFIPAKLREGLGESFYITRKADKCLVIYSEEEWTRLAEKLHALPDSKVGSLKRFLFSKAINAVPDSNGRVILPPPLLEYAGIQKNVVIVGSMDQVQIWAEEIWAVEEENLDPAAMAAMMEEVGL